MLRTENVDAGYGSAKIVHGMSIEIQAGEMVGVLGANGAGKSTFMKTIVGTVDMMGGEIYYQGDEITEMEPYRRARRGIGHVAQTESVFQDLTVRENLRMASFANPEGYERRVDEVYDLFPKLRDLQDQKAQVLSGGERKMLAIGCGVIIDPDLYLLDEPSDGLAPNLVSDIFEKVAQLQSAGKAMLVNEQKEEILDHIDRAYLLENGSIVDEGPADELLESGKIQKSYL